MWHGEGLTEIRPASLAVGIVYLEQMLSMERTHLGMLWAVRIGCLAFVPLGFWGLIGIGIVSPCIACERCKHHMHCLVHMHVCLGRSCSVCFMQAHNDLGD